MPKAHISPVSLFAAVAAAAVTLVYMAVGNKGYGYETTIVGISLLLILFAFDEEGYRSAFQGVAFASVAGLCAMLALGYPEVALMKPQSMEEWSAFTWLGTTLLFFAVDRMSASSRESTAMGIAAAPVPRATYTAPPAQAYVPAPAVTTTYAPAPVTYAPAPVPAPQPVSAPQPVYEAPVVVAAPVPTPVVQQPEPVAAAAPVAIAPIPPGREAMIFLNLLGEGLNVLRSVKAEHLGRDYYRIADVMPENERWEYEPNTVVRAKKKALSNGKHLVAFEEAPRA